MFHCCSLICVPWDCIRFSMLQRNEIRKRECFGIHSQKMILSKAEVKTYIWDYTFAKEDIFQLMVVKCHADKGSLVWWLVLFVSQQVHLNISWSFSVQSLYVLPVPVWIFSRCSSFHPQSKNMRIESAGHHKLPIGMNVRVSILPLC